MLARGRSRTTQRVNPGFDRQEMERKMTHESQPYNLSALREFLIQAFTTDELRALVSYDDRLKGLVREFAPTDPIAVMVDKAIAWTRAVHPHGIVHAPFQSHNPGVSPSP